MNREEAITLLTMVQLDRAAPPTIEPERMAALFVAVISDDPPDGLSAMRRCAWRVRRQRLPSASASRNAQVLPASPPGRPFSPTTVKQWPAIVPLGL
jgi:hypothetical protein